MSEAPIEIKNLVEKFNRNLDAYKNPSYKEEQLKQEFINPFFKALGWDVDNVSGAAPQYRDVIFEDSIKVGGGTKAPDYCFTLAGRKMFFVEAKKPSVNVKMSIEPSYQLRRYAWSAKLPLSILTDFEELAVYESRTKPQKKDRASTARIMFLNYQDYLEKWDEIYNIFSRESVLQGSFDKFAEATKKKRGTTEVDDSFLSEIEEWRDLFAKNIALRNPKITIEELNYSVQQTIDRIVFLRMCEDRGVEKYEQLRNLLDDDHIYHRFGEICLKADEKYNSGLFHFREEKERGTPPDNLTLSLNIDDKIFKTIIKGLYYPNSPYEFSVLSPEILGNVYEQFLGKVIRLTPGHQAKIEEKPEVKKAGGVYYTPQFIVDYIVENTVGKLCKGKTPNKISKLKILDPACGSGSFLLGAYTYLLKWHRDYYTNHKDKKRLKDKIYQGKGGEYYLTIREKKRILLNNIYGVDIDPQAVNVTKLSLLLKVLEGENRDALEAQQKLFKERALPDLGNNIKCGNSLIEPDIYDDPELELTANEIQQINPFDWQSEFLEIIDNGGFDAVVGNPPWGSFISKIEKKYLQNNYSNTRGEAESHLYFVEKGYTLLKESGMLGYITPNTWLSVINSKQIRNFLLNNVSFIEISELSKYIFDKAPDIVPILLFLTPKLLTSKCIVKRANVIKVTANNFNNVFNSYKINQKVWMQEENNIINLRATKTVIKILKRIQNNTEKLSDVANVLYGIKTGNNKKYLSEEITANHHVKALKTGELTRYNISWKNYYLWWCSELAGYRKTPINVPKIVIQYIRKISLPRRIIAAFDQKGIYYPLNNYSYITIKDNNYSLEYILGILNSNLINFYFSNKFIDYNIKPTYLKKLPIHKLDFENPDDVAKHNRLVTLVEHILLLNRELATKKTPDFKQRLLRQINATDIQIDNLVYKLYDLKDEEIKIVEDVIKDN